MKLISPVPLFPLKPSAGAAGAFVLVALLGLALYTSAKRKPTPTQTQGSTP